MTIVDTFSRLNSVFRSDDDGHNNNNIMVCTPAAVRVVTRERLENKKKITKKRTENCDCSANRVRCVDAQKRIIRIDVRRSENRVLCTQSLL